MADRCLIIHRDERVLLPNKIDQDSGLAINRMLFHLHVPALNRIMITSRNHTVPITAIMDPNATAVMAVW